MVVIMRLFVLHILFFNKIFQGMLLDGRVFDSSLQEGRSPLKFQLGMGKLIKGIAVIFFKKAPLTVSNT